MSLEDENNVQHSLRKVIALIITVVAVTLALFQLYTAGIGALTALRQRSIHLTLILVLVFLIYPPYKGVKMDRFNAAFFIDCILILLSLAMGSYLCIGLEEIFLRQGDWTTTDFYMSLLAMVLV